MGLGKTLQTLCIVASEHYQRSRGLTIADTFVDDGGKEDSGEQVKSKGSINFPSLIICPASVMGHWMHEVEMYFGHVLKPILYEGTASERRRQV